MKRPKCAVDDCENPAIVMFLNKLICGSCLIKLTKKQNENKWEMLNAAS